MSRRRSTIFDAAALRLHPNGVRISTTDIVPTSRSVLVKNKNTYRRKDARDNWIATDAGGHGKITKRRKIGTRDNNPGSASEAEAKQLSQAEEQPVRVFKDSRANRRVAFENDLTFLAAAENEGGVSSHLQPSSVSHVMSIIIIKFFIDYLISRIF
jgi:hypothetical protein